MTDAAHYFGSDLQFSANGDLLVADGLDESQQRILRRLLTNLKDYLWQPTYGAGLPSYIGKPLDEAAISLALLIPGTTTGERRSASVPSPSSPE